MTALAFPKNPMTLRERRRQERIYGIKDLSLQLIERRGVRHLSFRSIAELLGVSNKTPRQYFGSIAAIIDSVCVDGCTDLRTTLLRVERTEDGARENLVALATAELAWARRNRIQYLLLGKVRRSTSESAELRSAWSACAAVHVAALSDLFALERGTVSSEMVSPSAAETFGVYHSMMTCEIEEDLRGSRTAAPSCATTDFDDRIRTAIDVISTPTSCRDSRDRPVNSGVPSTSYVARSAARSGR